MDLTGIDYPVLMLAKPVHKPSLAGGDYRSKSFDVVDIAYLPEYGKGDVEDVHADKPFLRLRTSTRRGFRMSEHGATSIGSDLKTLGRQAVTSSRLGVMGHQPDPAIGHEAADRAMTDGRELGSRIPGAPWVLRSMKVGRTAYALWLLTFDDGRFCVVADCGPIVLTGEGQRLEAWTWNLRAVPWLEARQELRARR